MDDGGLSFFSKKGHLLTWNLVNGVKIEEGVSVQIIVERVGLGGY